ncbi:MAG: hypothetical protein Q4C34_05120 [Bacteroidales bacterium]|nr:hypothetical protein [Bacteroidales bacterium]
MALDPTPTPSLVPRSMRGYNWLPSSTASPVFDTTGPMRNNGRAFYAVGDGAWWVMPLCHC